METSNENVIDKKGPLNEHSSEIKPRIRNVPGQGKFLAEKNELQHVEEEHEILKAAVEMAFDDEHPVEFYIEQLSDQVDTRKHRLEKLDSEWDALRKPLEEKKRVLEEALHSTKPEVHEKLQQLKQNELETDSTLAKIKRREEDFSELSVNLERKPKVAPRKSYVERIKEITKNSRKQDADIELILKETRDLQSESNSIQERLHRTYAVVDETVFREARKDPLGRQAYRILTSIHETFGKIAENILATDRMRRDAADYEAKLATVGSRKINVHNLQADLDAIRKENDLLEQRLQGI